MRAGLIAALLVCITTSCSGSGAIRTGSDSCQCGQCYLQQSGAVIGYAISSDGTCAYGTDCGDCDYSSDANGGLATWQIALIICCGVLVFTVAVVSVLSCYCKARNRLYENEDAQADVSYYHQPYPGTRDHIVIGDGAGAAAGAAAGAGAATPSLFAQAPNSSRSQQRRSGSFTNDLKPLYSNSSQTNNPDRIGLGLAPVHTRSSSGDLAGSYPNERRPSASNRSIGRRPSLEQQYSARDRDSLAVEL
ncbi:hypothetical protein BBJ28_00020536 [Nothophytophthora sp. Chile5]|nr:hypothetical protein BBJ28_00020536 [Nothophytophthora sp. Chile5]